MRLSKKKSNTILLSMLGLSIAVWSVLWLNPNKLTMLEHCKVSAISICDGSTMATSSSSIPASQFFNPFSSQLMGWGIMVLAMMLPKLILPIKYIYVQSLKRNRFKLSILFVLGYLTTWMVAGIFLTFIILCCTTWFPNSYLPAMVFGLIALVYQCSPIKQRFLNLGHDHWILPAFGFEAFRKVFLFGIMHGVWCVGSGWALMIFPMLLTVGHNLAMMIVTFMMISEHLEHPQPLRWSMNPRLILLKYGIAQIKIWLTHSRFPTKEV